MKARIYILLFVTLCFASVQALRAQDAGGGQASGASVMPVSSVDSQGVKKYLLGPGDTVDVRVFGQPDLNWIGEVDSEGKLSSLPFVETPIHAQCRTEKELQKDIVAAYSKFLKNPQISVRITGRNSRPPATVLGAVLAPTRVQMQRRVRLNELIAASGGYTERANGDIQVLHTEPVMCPEPGEIVEPLFTDNLISSNVLKIYKISDLLAGKEAANPIIRPGDIVNVMEAKPVYITGLVTAPQPLLLREGMTLSKAIAMVGGVTTQGKSDDIRIYRTKPGAAEPEQPIRVSLDAIRKKKAADIALQPYDVVEVPKSSDWSPKAFLRLLTGAAMSSFSSIAATPATILNYKVIY